MKQSDLERMIEQARHPGWVERNRQKLEMAGFMALVTVAALLWFTARLIELGIFK